MRGGVAGEMAAHDVESRQVREGDGDEEGEDESTEEEEEAREEKGTGNHDYVSDQEPWTSCSSGARFIPFDTLPGCYRGRGLRKYAPPIVCPALRHVIALFALRLHLHPSVP